MAGGVQVPQLTVEPHPGGLPQTYPLVPHIDAGHPHWPETPLPPQVCGETQLVLQSMVPPHPSVSEAAHWPG